MHKTVKPQLREQSGPRYQQNQQGSIDMTSLTLNQQNCTINVPFYGSQLYVVNHDGEPFTPMKPIVDGMGMDWMGQYTKLKQRFAKGIEEISIPTAGGIQKMICLALRKLAAWLNTISPNKVKPEIRDRVIQYQDECDDVLYEYWTKGQVTNPRKTSTDERTPLRDAINLLVGKRGIMYPEAYSYVHQRFGVSHIEELPSDQLLVAVEYVHRLALEGELMPKEGKKAEVDVSMAAHNAEVACDSIHRACVELNEHVLPALKMLGSPVARTLTGLLNNAHGACYSAALSLNRSIKNLIQP